MKWIKPVALCLVFGLLTGCGIYNQMVDRIQERLEAEMESTVITRGQFSSSDQEEEDDDYNDEDYGGKPDNSYIKFNAYVDLANLISGRYSAVLERYERYYGLEETLRTDQPMSMLSIGEHNISKVEKLSTIIDLDPPMPSLDETVAPLIAPLLDVLNLLDNEMYGYYEMKNYVDDDFAKGKEYHQRLVTQLDSLYPLLDTFLYELDTLAAEMRAESLQQYKDEGLMIQYYTLRTIQSGKNLSAYLYEQELDNDTIHTADLDEFQPYYDALAEDVAQLFQWTGLPEQAELEPEFTNHILFSMLKSDVENLKKSSTEMYELIRDSKQVGMMGTGSPEELDDKLTSVINHYNQIIS